MNITFFIKNIKEKIKKYIYMLVLKLHLFALLAPPLGPIISPKDESDYKSEISFINQVDYYLSNPLIFISQLFLWENCFYVKYTQTQYSILLTSF